MRASSRVAESEAALSDQASVADTAYVGNGTTQDSRTLGRVGPREQTRTARPPRNLRVLATLAADVLALVVTALIASWLSRRLATTPLLGRVFRPFPEDPQGGALVLIALVPWWVATLYVFGLYREPGRSIGGSSVLEALAGLTALTVGSWLLLIGYVFAVGDRAPIAALIAFWLIAVVLVPLVRSVSRVSIWSRASFVERTLIIGAGEVGHTLAAKIVKHPEYRLRLVGFLDDGEPRRGKHGHLLPVVGALDDLEAVIEREGVNRVIVAFSRARHGAFLDVVRACADHGVKVNIVPRLFEVVSSRAGVDDIEGIPLLDIGHAELSRFNMAVKRVFDILVAGLFFVLILPPFAVISLLIKFDSPGPVLFRQERMGRGGRTFFIYKFRSMKVDAEKQRGDLADQNDYSGPMFKMHQDPRLTRIGGWLRRWSIDELPQVLNVLKGDMSLVGPRPLWVEEAAQCRGWTQKRLDITPGITGLWQVLGRSDIPFDEMVKLDYMYVTGWSLSWDVKLLLQTIPAVLEKRGAY
jgi:exopolysaccharide biosynthesis polyprenyl glycosylphosphotransferase